MWRVWLMGATVCLVMSTLLVALHYSQTLHSPNYCAMTYMSPSYRPIPVHSPWAYKYHLYWYREGGGRQRGAPSSPQGVPVLFIPGNAGHYQQARSLGATLAQYHAHLQQWQGEQAIEFDLYTVDSQEELGALSGQMLLEQTEFVNDCIGTILQRYEGRAQAPRSVILVAHSMGGTVATAILAAPNYRPGSVHTIFSLNSPHQRHVFFYRKSISDYYFHIHRYWQSLPLHSDLQQMALVSISGSFRDQLIQSELADVRRLANTSHAFAVVSTGLPGVQVQMDHVAIIWCRQMMQQLADTLYRLLDPHTGQNTRPLPQRMDLLARQFLNPTPCVLGLYEPSQVDWTPAPYLYDCIQRYHQPLPLSPHAPAPTLLQAIAHTAPQTWRVAPAGGVWTSMSGGAGEGDANPTSPPPWVYARPEGASGAALHFVFLTDVPPEHIQVYACSPSPSGHCSADLRERQAIPLPRESSLRPYDASSRPSGRTPRAPDDRSPQTLVHLSPAQLEGVQWVLVRQADAAAPAPFRVAQFYQEAASPRSLPPQEGWMARALGVALFAPLRLPAQRPLLSNLSLPLHDKHVAYTMRLTREAEACGGAPPAFPAVIIQYRPLLHEQHISPNASHKRLPLRFHMSSPYEQRLLVLADPECEYRLQVEVDGAVTVSSVVFSFPTANMAAMGAMFLAILSWQQRYMARHAHWPSFAQGATALLGLVAGLLLLSLFVLSPLDHFLSLSLESLPAPLHEHSFFYWDSPGGWMLRGIVGVSFCALVCVYGVYGLGLYLYGFLIAGGRRLLHRGPALTWGPSLALTLLVLAVGHATHIILVMLFSAAQLAVCCTRRASPPPEPDGALSQRHYQQAVLFMVLLGVAESIPNALLYGKALLYEARSDDGTLYFEYSLIVLSFLACHTRPHPRRFLWCGTALASGLILVYGLVLFHRVGWFFSVVLLLQATAHWPLQPLPPSLSSPSSSSSRGASASTPRTTTTNSTDTRKAVPHNNTHSDESKKIKVQ